MDTLIIIAVIVYLFGSICMTVLADYIISEASREGEPLPPLADIGLMVFCALTSWFGFFALGIVGMIRGMFSRGRREAEHDNE